MGNSLPTPELILLYFSKLFGEREPGGFPVGQMFTPDSVI